MIETRQLSKRYGNLTAVDNISFKVEPGQVLGFLGPNGAGKSTTMKMIAGFLAPTSGSVNVCGHDVADAPLKAKSALGYLPEGAPSYGEMTPREFLAFIADMRGLAGAHRTQRIDDVIERLHLNAVLEQPIDAVVEAGEVPGDADPRAAEPILVDERRVVRLDVGSRGPGVPFVRAGQRRQQRCRVGDGPGHRPRRVLRVRDRDDAGSAHEADRRLDADEAVDR